jgi:hypothetical protein
MLICFLTWINLCFEGRVQIHAMQAIYAKTDKDAQFSHRYTRHQPRGCGIDPSITNNNIGFPKLLPGSQSFFDVPENTGASAKWLLLPASQASSTHIATKMSDSWKIIQAALLQHRHHHLTILIAGNTTLI